MTLLFIFALGWLTFIVIALALLFFGSWED